MVFSSLVFLYLFLPLCLGLYFVMPGIQRKNTVLILCGLFFYAWGEPFCVLLLILSAAMNWCIGLLMEADDGRKWFFSGIALNLTLLILFKYTDFFLTTLNRAFSLSLPLPGIALPVGISFYTFQCISYLVDVRRGEVPPQRSFRSFLLYVSLFPQLIAGPILRYREIAPQLTQRDISPENVFHGLFRFCIGLGKKVLIANYAGSAAEEFLSGSSVFFNTAGLWFGLALFALQIYFDFSGYSDMAIGLGRIFGFRYGENFNLPYCASSIAEFWRRWHISLGSFFRDYVYIPLGGSRVSRLRTGINLFVVWALTGLWHGAGWNFVLWGLYFFLLLSMEKLLSPLLDRCFKPLRHLLVILLLVFGWSFFFFTDFSRLCLALSVLLGGGSLCNAATLSLMRSRLPLLLLGILGSTAIPRRMGSSLSAICLKNGNMSARRCYALLCFGFGLFLLALSTISILGSGFNPFLYFRF